MASSCTQGPGRKAHSCLQRVPQGGRHTQDNCLFISCPPVVSNKHINTFRQLDCTNLGVLCVFLLPHAIASPQFFWEKV